MGTTNKDNEMMRIIFRIIIVSLVMTGVAVAVSFGIFHVIDPSEKEFQVILGWAGLVLVMISLILFSGGPSEQHSKSYAGVGRFGLVKIPFVKKSTEKSDGKEITFDISGICFFITGAAVWAISYYI